MTDKDDRKKQESDILKSFSDSLRDLSQGQRSGIFVCPDENDNRKNKQDNS